MSFLTGRYPHHTLTWNFVNHFRQAVCVELKDQTIANATTAYRTLAIRDGGAGQCCSFCTADGADKCAAWTLTNGQCTLYRQAQPARAAVGTIGGGAGSLALRNWTSLPQHFTKAGYLTLQTGKIFHTEEGGAGPAPWDGPGTGMPPLQDPPSWSRQFNGNLSLANVNAIAPMRPCEDHGCSINATRAGDVPAGVFRFCDQIISDDAVDKLRLAATTQRSSGQPFFLAVGFRKPHLPFRHPAPWDKLYTDPAAIPLATHKVLDPSVPPIAFHQTSLAQNPYVPMENIRAGTLRRDYYAAISWMDWNLGRVLTELSALGLDNSTLVVFHADHGWSLGEHGEWEKFTNFEHGTRVPLVIRAPWISGAAGTSTTDIAELVDIFPTVADLAGIAVPSEYQLDGASLRPALEAAAAVGTAALAAGHSHQPCHTGTSSKPTSSSNCTRDTQQRAPITSLALANYALSVYPRCPADLSNASNFWRNNDCLFTERIAFPFMGLSLRVDEWRYTEWLHWNASCLCPDFARKAVGVELYNHQGDPDTTFDGPWEQHNLAGQAAYATIEAQLAAQLRRVYPLGPAWPQVLLESLQ